MCSSDLLGETIDDFWVVKKFLRVAPSWFSQIVVSIEMFVDLKTLTVEELVGRLRAMEERFDDKIDQIVDKAGRLLLAEEVWLEKHKHRFHPGNKAGGSGGGGVSSKGKAIARSDGGASGQIRLTSMGTPGRKGRCRNCGIYGHCHRFQRLSFGNQQQRILTIGFNQRNYCFIIIIIHCLTNPVIHLGKQRNGEHNITASPNTRFHGSSRASSPAEALAQRLITGDPISVSEAFSTRKFACIY